MFEPQKEWALAMEETAKKNGGDWWRVAIAIGIWESSVKGVPGMSSLARNHNNLFGLTVKGPMHKSADSRGHRHFDNPEAGWRSLRDRIDIGPCYGHVRLIVRHRKSRGALDEEIERAVIESMADPYCVPPDPWRDGVLRIHEDVCRLFAEQKEAAK